MQVHVKNMVCDRCIKAVTSVFQKAGVPARSITLGIVETDNSLSETKAGEIKELLRAEGFEWLDDQKIKLVEMIKKEIVHLVHYGELDEMRQNLSDHLAGKLKKDYPYLSNIFSSAENTTIEQYFILQKIEKVKELLVYGELTLSQIAFSMGYSSVAHLSGQFKKITGFTAGEFKKLKNHCRKPIDQL